LLENVWMDHDGFVSHEFFTFAKAFWEILSSKVLKLLLITWSYAVPESKELLRNN